MRSPVQIWIAAPSQYPRRHTPSGIFFCAAPVLIRLFRPQDAPNENCPLTKPPLRCNIRKARVSHIQLLRYGGIINAIKGRADRPDLCGPGDPSALPAGAPAGSSGHDPADAGLGIEPERERD